MTLKEIIGKVLEETHIISSALEAKDIDIALKALSRRKEWIDKLGTIEKKEINPEIEELVKKFNEENKQCMEKLAIFKDEIQHEANVNKSRKVKVKTERKIHEQYTNPYTGGVGTSFDLKK